MKRSPGPMVITGYVLAVLFPVLGLILGIVVFSNGPQKHGIGITVLAIVCGTVSYVWLF
jgi:hypothetical protein